MMPANNIYKIFFIPAFLFLFAIINNTLNAQEINRNFNPGIGKDTILFDGDSPIQLNSKTDNCPVKVTYSKGTTKGKRIVQKTIQFCSGPGIMNVEEDGPRSTDDVLAPGSNISTGDNSAVQLQMLDGSIIRIGPNSNFTLGDCNFDDQSSKLSIKLIMGEAWSAVQHALGGDATNYETQTGNATAGVRGTKYSVDNYILNGDTVTVLKVYEGTVEFRSSFDKSNDAHSIAARNQKLGEDYAAGKITLDEYLRLNAEANTTTLDVVSKFKVMVEAGFTSTVTGSGAPTEPKPFTPDGNEWFADKNFMK